MRILLIDDHALFRAGLETLLARRGIEVIGSASKPDEGITIALEKNPDVVLLDLRMPGTDGLAALKQLREKGFSNPVSMLTTSIEEKDLINCLKNGAQGYLLKDMEPDDLVKALHQIHSGEMVVAPELAGVLAKVVRGPNPESEPTLTGPLSDLTPRETEILMQLAEGLSNKLIARELGISDGTVKLHVKSILRKLNMHSRVEAAVFAVEQGVTLKTLKQDT